MTDLLQLYEQSTTQHEARDLRQTLGPMLDGLSRALGYRRALVALYEPGRHVLRGSVGLSVPEALAESLEVPLAAETHPLVEALLRDHPVRVESVASDQRLPEPDRELLLEMGMTSLVVAPLRTGEAGEVGPTASQLPLGGDERASTHRRGDLPAAGVVLLSKEGTITDQDIEWLMPFANQAGVALAKASDVEALRSSSEQRAVEKEWLWLMLTAVDDPVVLTDAQNDIILHNLRAEKIFRSNPEDSEGKRHAISMNNFLFTAALSTGTLEAGRRSSRELTLVDPIEGTELLFEVISHTITNYVIGTRGTVSVLKDVTALRQAAEQLNQNVQRLQSADEEIRLERDRLDLVLSSVPNPILVVDNDNQIVTMNQEALRMLRPTAPGGHPSFPESRKDQIALSNDAKFSSFLAQLRLDMAQVKTGELALVDPDSEETLPMWVSAREIRDRVGAVTAIVATMHNLATIRELEQRRVEQVLFDSEKLAATGRLAASIAHEINNPLEAIKNSLYLLVNKTAPDDPNYRFLEIAKKETERVSRILSQMLGFYRPTASMAQVDLKALIEEAESLVEKHLRQRGVRLHNDLSAALPQVRASADQIKQVILNLLLNAGDAMPGGGGNIYVSTHASSEASPDLLLSDAVNIQIRDTGKGIADEHVPHIFEPFFSTKQEGKGTGLGLWVSFNIVRSHGGNIRVRSRPGRGTTFTITLPINGPPPDLVEQR
jgi:PAS domain S-box-containing protein